MAKVMEGLAKSELSTSSVAICLVCCLWVGLTVVQKDYRAAASPVKSKHKKDLKYPKFRTRKKRLTKLRANKLLLRGRKGWSDHSSSF